MNITKSETSLHTPSSSLQAVKEYQESNVSKFTYLNNCWICGGRQLVRIHRARFDLKQFKEQDPQLAEYTGHLFYLQRCRNCGFAQPDVLPTLPGYFDRIYNQRWSEEWMEMEFESGSKDFIIHHVLKGLTKRVPAFQRTLLDVGAHVGRLIYLAQQSGWQAEGVELNPLTSSYAARKTNLPVHQVDASNQQLEKKYGAVTMIDVLEHIPDPLKVLKLVCILLDRNGWIVVKVPCGRSQLIKEHVRSCLRTNYEVSVGTNMVHINHFSPTSLRLALQTSGFSNIKICIGAPQFWVSQGASASLRKMSTNLIRSSFFHLAGILPGGVYTPLAVNLQAYAQRSA